jgi:hypothetical protein
MAWQHGKSSAPRSFVQLRFTSAKGHFAALFIPMIIGMKSAVLPLYLLKHHEKSDWCCPIVEKDFRSSVKVFEGLRRPLQILES